MRLERQKNPLYSKYSCGPWVQQQRMMTQILTICWPTGCVWGSSRDCSCSSSCLISSVSSSRSGIGVMYCSWQRILASSVTNPHLPSSLTEETGQPPSPENLYWPPLWNLLVWGHLILFRNWLNHLSLLSDSSPEYRLGRLQGHPQTK